MLRWFLSYHSPDQALAERLKAAIERRDAASRVFFAPTQLRAGGSWSAQLAQQIADATAFILLIGEAGIGKWQVAEYDEALDKWVTSGRKFPLILVLLEGQIAPGLQFLRQLHWIITPDPASEKDIGRLFDAASGESSSPGELWRYASPYRGLEAMEEKDSDYFFAASAKPLTCCARSQACPTDCRCSSAIPAWANPRWRRQACWRHSSARHGPKERIKLVNGRPCFTTAVSGVFCRSSPARIR
jgi:hypothetical protein